MKSTARIIGTVTDINEAGIFLNIKGQKPGFLSKKEFDYSGIDYKKFQAGDIIDAFPTKRIQDGRECLSLYRRGGNETSSIFNRCKLDELLETMKDSDPNDFSIKEEILNQYVEIILKLKGIGEDALQDEFNEKAFDFLKTIIQEKIEYEIEETGEIDAYLLQDYIQLHCERLLNTKNGSADNGRESKTDKSLFSVISKSGKNLRAYIFYYQTASCLWHGYVQKDSEKYYDLIQLTYDLFEAALIGLGQYAENIDQKILYWKSVYCFFQIHMDYYEIVGSTPLMKHVITILNDPILLENISGSPKDFLFIAKDALEMVSDIPPDYYSDHSCDFTVDFFSICYKTAAAVYGLLAESDQEKYDEYAAKIINICNVAIESLTEVYEYYVRFEFAADSRSESISYQRNIAYFVCLKISYAGRETLYSDDVKGGIVDISGQQQEVIA